MTRRRYRAKVNAVPSTLFTDHAHRLPAAGEPIVYAMACVELVANWSPRGRELYQEMAKAWAAPGLKLLYEQVMAEVPEQKVGEWKQKLRTPGAAFTPNLNQPGQNETLD